MSRYWAGPGSAEDGTVALHVPGREHRISTEEARRLARELGRLVGGMGDARLGDLESMSSCRHPEGHEWAHYRCACGEVEDLLCVHCQSPEGFVRVHEEMLAEIRRLRAALPEAPHQGEDR